MSVHLAGRRLLRPSRQVHTNQTNELKGSVMTHAFGDTPMSRCDYYTRKCGLPAIVDPPTTGRIVVQDSTTWALMMPATLGTNVKALMCNRGERTGPILSHPRSRRWTFLIKPDLPDEVSLYAEMFRQHVSIMRGTPIALPSPVSSSPNSFRVWVEHPTTPYRPSGVAVIAAIRGCVDHKRARRFQA